VNVAGFAVVLFRRAAPEPDHVTDCDGPFVPATVAVSDCVLPPGTLAGDGEIVTPVIVGAAAALVVKLVVTTELSPLLGSRCKLYR
jgi:hypothetical protein